jgi:UDP-N-acetylmuramate: L-alanyl-gamma-D-glutamyl-meso-diaminopimelate ligase
MGALAGLLQQAGHEVRGSDVELYPPMSTQLAASGIPVATGYGPANLDWGPDCVVVGNVCSKDHPEVAAAQERGLPLESFPGLMAKTLLEEREVLVVAGTHGKTTTTSALAWMLSYAGQDPSYLIGGVPLNLGRGSNLGGGSAFVLEGDEYDTAFFDKGSKFLHYGPKRACLTGVEFDHADIFSGLEEVRVTFRKFVALIPEDGDLVVNLDDAEAMEVATAARCRKTTYRVLADRGLETSPADYCCVISSRGSDRRTTFEVFEGGQSLGEFSTQLIGRFNVSNLLGALALARRHGLGVEPLREAVRRFRGVKRRQEVRGLAHGVRVIEDFAHHPTAVQLALTAVRRRYPEQRLHACFEPRSATSRRRIFLEPYAGAFDAADHVYVGPMHSPEKVPEDERLDPVLLAQAITPRGVPARAFGDVESLTSAVLEEAVPGDTIVTLSSGSFGDLATRLLFGFGDPLVFATAEDAEAIDALLDSYGVPAVIASNQVETLVIRHRLEDPSEIVGCVCVEVTGECAFLFGLAVERERRGQGLGWILGDAVMRRARTLGARTVYLATSTAADFFASKLGFSPVDLDEVEPLVRGSENFRAYAALANAVCMVCELTPENGR